MDKTKWTWAEFRSQVAVGLVTSIALAAIAAVWTFLKVYALLAAEAFGGFAAVGAALFVAFALVGLANQLQQMDRASQIRRLIRRTPRDIQKQIRDWLWRYKFSVQDDPIAIADFRLKVDDDRQVPLTIAKAIDAPWITISSNILFEPEKRTALGPRLERIVEDMGLELIRLGMEWQPRLEDGATIGMSVGHLMPFSVATTDLELLRGIKLVRGAMAIVATIFNRAAAGAIAAAPPPKKMK
jgi:hypothetical protein